MHVGRLTTTDGVVVFCFKQKTAYEMRISDWSSDVCSADLRQVTARAVVTAHGDGRGADQTARQRTGRGRMIVRDFQFDRKRATARIGAVADLDHRCIEMSPGIGIETHISAIADANADEIGRASCRERVCQYV